MIRLSIMSLVGYLTLTLPGITQLNDPAARNSVDLKKMEATITRLRASIPVNVEDLPLRDAIKLIGKETKLRFVSEQPLPVHDVGLKKTNWPLGELLHALLKQFDWTYAVLPNGDILLRPRLQAVKSLDGDQ